MQARHVLLATLLTVVALPGCTLPRGAPLESEIVRSAQKDEARFSVVPVTRSNLDMIAAWPATGAGGLAGWIGAGHGGDGGLIRAGDVVSVTIWDNATDSLLVPPGTKRVDLSGLQVSSSGAIFLPYAGEVSISGQTPDQARATIEAKLVGVAPSSQVVLTRAAGKQNSVDLVTGVAKPGTYSLQERQHSILSLLAEGGGIQSGLRNPVVRLIRSGKTYEITAEQLLSDGRQDTALRGGDKVIVEADARYYTALGATGVERLIYFEKAGLTALEAISSAGGITDNRANPRGVLVLRDYPARAVRRDAKGPDTSQVVFTFDLTTAEGLFAARAFRIFPKDTVMATESPVISIQTISGLLGSAIGLRNAATD